MVRRAALLGLALVTSLGTAAGDARAAGSPAQVVRAWSAALNSGRDDDAASLFAPNAEVIQGPLDIRLPTHAVAVQFNASLPCAGRIIRITVHGERATATFVLGKRPGHQCTGPGQRAAALFVVRAGRIVLWEQVPVPAAPAKKPSGPSI